MARKLKMRKLNFCQRGVITSDVSDKFAHLSEERTDVVFSISSPYGFLGEKKKDTPRNLFSLNFSLSYFFICVIENEKESTSHLKLAEITKLS